MYNGLFNFQLLHGEVTMKTKKVTGTIPTKHAIFNDLRKVITMTVDIMEELSKPVSIQITENELREKVQTEINKQVQPRRRANDEK